MRTRPALDALRWSLLAALGVPVAALVACGGVAEGESEDQGTGGAAGGSGGTVSGTGGSTTGGGGGSGGGSTGGGSTGGGSTGGSAGEQFGVCTNPQPFGGEDTGFVICDEGYLRRPEKKTCSSSVPRAGERPPVSEELDQCHADSDCEGQYAYCDVTDGGLGLRYNACATGCVEDADCGEGALCLCGDPVGRCVSMEGPDGCDEDSDCPGEAQCLGQILPSTCGGTSYHFACEKADDECRANQDCDAGEDCTSERTCFQPPVCGRPFLVELAERRAASCERGDWSLRTALADGSPLEGALTEGMRARLAEHWERIGLMEHASIAAFARFSLQLLSLGAPADLIEETNQALVDETRHARLCFGLASHYAGRDLGPGALDMSGALESLDAADILRTTILEGCVGETLAALEATEAAALARDPRVVEVLNGIADDEARHARLAWRFVQWLVGERPELREVARETFRGLADEGGGRRVSAETGEEDLSAFGVLSRATSRRLRVEALRAVVAPCAEQLLSPGGAGPRERAPSGRSAEIPLRA